MELFLKISIVVLSCFGMFFMVCFAIYDILPRNKKKREIESDGELIIQKSDQTCYIAINEEVADKIPEMKQVTLDVKVRK